MEDYQYMNGRGRSGLQFQSWGTGAGNGYEATDAWNRSSASSGLQLGGVGAGARDHVCRPMIVGSDGTTMPAVLECPPRYNNHHYNDGYGTNGFSGVGGNVARWEYGGDSYAFEKRNKPKDFLDHVHDAAMSGYGLSTPGNGNGFQRHKAGYGSYDAAAAGGAYGAGANGWGTMGSGWGAPAASHGATPLGMATTYIIETAAESLLDSKKPAASAYSGGNWESWNSSKAKNKKHGGSVSSIGKEAAKKYAGQFIW